MQVDKKSTMDVEYEGIGRQRIFDVVEWTTQTLLREVLAGEEHDVHIVCYRFDIENVRGIEDDSLSALALQLHLGGQCRIGLWLMLCFELVIERLQLLNLVPLHTIVGDENLIGNDEGSDRDGLLEMLEKPFERQVSVIITPQIVPMFPTPTDDDEELSIEYRVEQDARDGEAEQSLGLIFSRQRIVDR